MLTMNGGGKQKDNNNLNETQSTFLGNQPSTKQQIEIFSNFHNGKDARKIKHMLSNEKQQQEQKRDEQNRGDSKQMTAAEKKTREDAYKYHAERRNLIARIN